MRKKLVLLSWIFAATGFSSSFNELTAHYESLMTEYNSVAIADDLTQLDKTTRLQDISEQMRHVNLDDSVYLGKDYNDCMRESNKQHDKDMDRCDRNQKGDNCYDRADRNNDDRRAACERVAHSDNARDTASSKSSSKKTSGGPKDRR